MARSYGKWMNLTGVGAFSLLATAALSFADPPPLVRYQARLTDAAGVPLAGPQDLSFAIYDQATGGILLWAESRPGTSVDAGLLDILLGEVTPLTSNLVSAGDRWLEVVVGSTPLAPRQRLSSVPFSLVTHRLGTMTLADVQADTDARVAAHGGAADPHAVYLREAGGTMTGTLTLSPASGNALLATAGNVGIGTLTPGQKLTVAGTIESTSGGLKFPDGSLQSTAVPPLGRTPISGPTTISLPGYYYLTQDISIAGGTAITINASQVRLDLNGHRITSSASTGILINTAFTTTDLIIENGYMSGASTGVTHAGGGGVTPIRLRVESVHFSTMSFPVAIGNAEYIEILSSRFTGISNMAINVDGSAGPFRGRLAGNTIESPGSRGISLNCLSGGQVSHNVINNYGSALAEAAGIHLGSTGCIVGGNLVEGNVIRGGGSDDYGIYVLGGSSDNVLLNNVVSSPGLNGIRLFSGRNRVAENLVNGAGGDSVYVTSSSNLIEGNVLEDNVGFAINFAGGAGNAYRNNMLRANGAGATGGAGTRTDAGGNII